MILYFSGTGNSQYVAKHIAAVIDDDIISLNQRIKTQNDDSFLSQRPYVFVMPTYAWRIPRIAEEFIQNTSFNGSKKAYFVMTCGDGTGNAAQYLKKLCADKGFEFMGLSSIVMPENYIARYYVPDQVESWDIIKKAEPDIHSTAIKIKVQESLQTERHDYHGWFLSTVINPIFYAFIVKDKGFYSTESCISCGKCVKLCPINNVHLVKGQPVWGGNCTHCMACICGCPTEAIEYTNKSKGKPRYFISE